MEKTGTDPDFSPAALDGLIRAYAGLGVHRTGSPGDEATSGWLIDWLGQRGVEAGAIPFPFPKVECRAAFAEVGGERIEGTPLYDGGATGSEGLEGVLIQSGAGRASGRIVLLEDSSLAEYDALIEEAAAPAPPLAAIAVSGDPEGYVVLRNAERMHAPFALPVLQVASRNAGEFARLAQEGGRVRLVIDRNVAEARATNVVADIPARGADGLVVLMTPKSGWFHCAAERGGGVAISMALAARAATLPGRRKALRVLFTSGHELGHRGLLHYLAQNARLREQAELWIQLGASIGARYPQGMRLFSRAQAWRDWFPPVLERHGAGPVALAAKDVRPGGESREVFDHPFVAFAGHHAYFHSPRDLPEVSVDANKVSRFGRAFAELLERALG